MPTGTVAAVAVLALLLAGAGCGGERVNLDHEGQACISANGAWPTGPQELEADATLYAIILFHSCLSSTCDVDRTASCSVDIEGSQIFLRGLARYTDLRGPGVSCTSGCERLEATCVLDPLPAGEYEVRYGDETISLELPSTTGVYCVGPDV